MKQLILIFGIVCAVATAPVFAQETEAEEAPEPAWVGSLGLSWVATSGNTDTSSIGADFALDRKPEPWGLSLVARGTRADDQGEKTAENYLVSARAVRALGKRWELRIGMQDIFWGATESRRLVDGVNQRDLVGGGEDYRLLITGPQGIERRVKGLTQIGDVVVREEGVRILGLDGVRRELPDPLFSHFGEGTP